MNKNRNYNKIKDLAIVFAIPLAIYFVLVLLIGNRIFNWNSVKTILIITVIPTITAYGVAFGFISGIMDFSVGSRMVISGIFAAIGGYYLGFIGLILGAVISSVILSYIVGGVFEKLKIPSIVVSLGMMMVFEVVGIEIVEYISHKMPALAPGMYVKMPSKFVFLGTAPWNFVILLLSAALFYVLYYRTEFSVQARMVGSDELIAKNIGINPMRVKFITFIVGGIFLGIASLVSACYSSAVGYKQNMESLSLVFKPMMAVVIGMFLQKHAKMHIGIFVGSLSLSIIFTGIIALGWPDSLQNVILGLFMLIVLAFPTIQQKLEDAKRRKTAKHSFEAIVKERA